MLHFLNVFFTAQGHFLNHLVKDLIFLFHVMFLGVELTVQVFGDDLDFSLVGLAVFH